MVHLSLSLAPLPMLSVAIAVSVLGIFVLARERAAAVAISFAVLTTTVSIWLIAVALMTVVIADREAFILARVAYVGVALIPAAVLQFTTSLVEATKNRRRMLIAAWSMGALFVALFTTTRSLLVGTWRYEWGYYPRLTDASALFLAYFAIVLAAALFILGKAQPHSARELRRNRAFLVALSVGYLGSVDYLPAFGIDLYPIGCLAILGFMALVVRSMIRYELRDLSPSFVAERLLQTMHGGVIVVDTRGRVRVVNQVAAQLLGYASTTEMRETDLRSLLGVKTLPATDSESFCRRAMTRDRIVQWRKRDGAPVELSIVASALRDEEGNAHGVLYALSAAEYKANHDLLTALPNRARFIALVDESKDRIIASGRIPAVLFVDLDGFKAVNDEHGHAAGDAVLQMVAKRIRNSIRGDDLLARYAGDEFVLRVDLARPDDAAFVATKLVRIISESYSIEEQQVTIGASIGVAFYPRDGRTAEELLRVADRAMYGAKRAGKGRAHIATPRTDKASPPPFTVNATA